MRTNADHHLFAEKVKRIERFLMINSPQLCCFFFLNISNCEYLYLQQIVKKRIAAQRLCKLDRK